MAVSSSRRKLTYQDLFAFPDELRRELIDGEVYVLPASGKRHQRIQLRLAFAVEAHVRAVGAGEVFIPPFDVKLSDFSVVQPDLIYVAPEDDEPDNPLEPGETWSPLALPGLVVDVGELLAD